MVSLRHCHVAYDARGVKLEENVVFLKSDRF